MKLARKSQHFHLSPAVCFTLPLSLFHSLLLPSHSLCNLFEMQPRLCNCKFLLISLSTPRCHCQLRIAYCKSQRSPIKLHTLSAPSSVVEEDSVDCCCWLLVAWRIEIAVEIDASGGNIMSLTLSSAHGGHFSGVSSLASCSQRRIERCLRPSRAVRSFILSNLI